MPIGKGTIFNSCILPLNTQMCAGVPGIVIKEAADEQNITVASADGTIALTVAVNQISVLYCQRRTSAAENSVGR